MKLTLKNKMMIYGAWQSLDGTGNKESFADSWNITVEALDNIIRQGQDADSK